MSSTTKTAREWCIPPTDLLYSCGWNCSRVPKMIYYISITMVILQNFEFCGARIEIWPTVPHILVHEIHAKFLTITIVNMFCMFQGVVQRWVPLTLPGGGPEIYPRRNTTSSAKAPALIDLCVHRFRPPPRPEDVIGPSREWCARIRTRRDDQAPFLAEWRTRARVPGVPYPFVSQGKEAFPVVFLVAGRIPERLIR